MSVWQFEPPRLETESINNGLTKSETIQWRTRCERSTAPPPLAYSRLPWHAPTVCTFFSQKVEYKIHTSLFLCSLSLALPASRPSNRLWQTCFLCECSFLLIPSLTALKSPSLPLNVPLDRARFIFILSYCLQASLSLPLFLSLPTHYVSFCVLAALLIKCQILLLICCHGAWNSISAQLAAV